MRLNSPRFAKAWRLLNGNPYFVLDPVLQSGSIAKIGCLFGRLSSAARQQAARRPKKNGKLLLADTVISTAPLFNLYTIVQNFCRINHHAFQPGTFCTFPHRLFLDVSRHCRPPSSQTRCRSVIGRMTSGGQRPFRLGGIWEGRRARPAASAACALQAQVGRGCMLQLSIHPV